MHTALILIITNMLIARCYATTHLAMTKYHSGVFEIRHSSEDRQMRKYGHRGESATLHAHTKQHR